MPTAAASSQIGRNVLASQYPGHVAQAFPTALIVGIQDEKPCSALLVEQIDFVVVCNIIAALVEYDTIAVLVTDMACWEGSSYDWLPISIGEAIP
jgi:hypothetical protein